MRIASSTLYDLGQSSMTAQESTLATLTADISSGIKLNTPADDPAGAAQAVTLQTALSANSQYTANQTSATTSLNLEDSTLGSVSTTLTQIQSLIVEAGNPSLTPANRQALAQQVSSARNQLLADANTTDAAGNYIFSGYQSSTAAYANNTTGTGASYLGDSGQKMVQVSASRQIAVNDTGVAVFGSVQAGAANGIATAGAANTGSATISQLALVQPNAADVADTYSVQFQISDDTPPVTTYTVQDLTATGQPTTTPAPYTAGQTIALGAGQTLELSGTPAAGDTFSVAPATTQSNIFTTLDNLISALNAPVSGNSASGGNVALTNSLYSLGTEVSNSLNNVLAVRASVGAREQELNSLSTTTSNQATSLNTQLTGLTNTNITTAATQFAEAQTVLQAAQKAFISVQGLSLFSLINPQ